MQGFRVDCFLALFFFFFFFFCITLGLELSDSKVYEPEIRTLLGTVRVGLVSSFVQMDNHF